MVYLPDKVLHLLTWTVRNSFVTQHSQYLKFIEQVSNSIFFSYHNLHSVNLHKFSCEVFLWFLDNRFRKDLHSHFTIYTKVDHYQFEQTRRNKVAHQTNLWVDSRTVTEHQCHSTWYGSWLWTVTKVPFNHLQWHHGNKDSYDPSDVEWVSTDSFLHLVRNSWVHDSKCFLTSSHFWEHFCWTVNCSDSVLFTDCRQVDDSWFVDNNSEEHRTVNFSENSRTCCYSCTFIADSDRQTHLFRNCSVSHSFDCSSFLVDLFSIFLYFYQIN